jgi:hypothetical protein
LKRIPEPVNIRDGYYRSSAYTALLEAAFPAAWPAGIRLDQERLREKEAELTLKMK